MTRLLRVVVHNWPLKLAAIGLATLLYGGLILPQNALSLPGVIAVDGRDLPDDTFLLTAIEPVTEVRYFSPTGVPAIASSFEAWIDLGSVPVGSGPVTVPIQIRAIDERLTVVGSTPDVVTVELDRIITREVPVDVQYAPAPAGLQVGTTTREPALVTVSGPASAVERVASARASVIIQPSGISVDQDVTLIPVDLAGNAVSPVNLEPSSARIKIPVFQDLRNKSLPVSPVITGTPAAGFEIASVTVEPSVLTVEGDAEELAALARVDTAPVSTNGASANFTVEAELAVPAGVVPVDSATVTVTVTLRPVTATRTFEAGLSLLGARPEFDYRLSTDRVLLTLGGSNAALDRLSGATLVGELDVANLVAGTTQVTVTIDLPSGVALVAASPRQVTVTVTALAVPSAPASSAAPAPLDPSPSTSPGG